MASIFIYNYNNYYNRRVKGQNNTLSDYGTPIYMESGNAVNFNPADGVNTIFTAGKLNNSYTGKGDYFIYSEDNTSITSRWFILEADRTRNGQYKLQLRRDVIVDNYDAVLSADTFISRATVSGTSPFILNQEPIAFNQIKKKEQPLYDETGCAWIVGYIDRKYAQSNTDLKFTINADPVYDYTKENWTFFKQYGTSVYGHYTSRKLLTHPLDTVDLVVTTDQYEKLYWDWTEYSQAVINEGLAQSGLVIKDGNKYYRVEAEIRNAKKLVGISTDKQGIYLHTYYTQKFGQQTTFVLEYALPHLVLTLVPMPSTVELQTQIPGKVDAEAPAQVRPGLTDAPYDMFCMPYFDGTMYVDDIKIDVVKEVSLAAAQSIALEIGNANIYDLQLLPFCPVSGWSKNASGEPTISLRYWKYNTIYNRTGTTNTYYSVMLWCTQSHGSKNIILEDMPSYTNRKVANQCDMYRLVSPNYNGQFEFNLAQNNTPNLPYFNVDYTYMPYNPYIHVNPYFDGLYGKDFNDARGLVCQGDYSVAYLSDAWKSYQISNKNYQNIFDRQIQNMSTNYKLNSSQKMIESGLGAVGVGAAAGLTVGGPLGALVGTGVGGLSAIGGTMDMVYDYDRYAEQKRYAKDTHNYQLDNIKALPYSLAKTTVINENNKIVPILETYTCTDEEKTAFAKEIRTRGMTLGIVDKIGNYTANEWAYEGIEDMGFIKGEIIHIDNLEDDAHTANAIASEIEKGVYFK